MGLGIALRSSVVVLVLLGLACSSQGSSTCDSALNLPPPYVDITMAGTTVNKPIADDGCSRSDPAVTYHITPSVGNEVTLMSCGPVAQTDLWVTVYTGSCSSPVCVLSQGLYSDPSCIGNPYKITFEAERAEYWVSVSSWDDGEGQFAININEGVRNVPPPDCDIALSVFGPYDPPLTMYGYIEPISTARARGSGSVITILDHFDVDTDLVRLDATQGVPASASLVAFSESLPFGSRVMSVTVVDYSIARDVAQSLVTQSQWAIGIGFVTADVTVTYEASSSATMDVTLLGYANGLRITSTYINCYSFVVGATFTDTQGRQSSAYTAFYGVSTRASADIHYDDLEGNADLTNIRKIAVTVNGVDVDIALDDIAFIGPRGMPSASPTSTLPCSGIQLTTGVVWYKLFPSETFVTVSTCNSGSAIATDIGIYEGECSDLVCVPSNTRTCDNGATVQFQNRGSSYYVSVSGRYGAIGMFELSIDETWYDSWWDETLPMDPSELPSISVFPSLLDDDGIVVWDDDDDEVVTPVSGSAGSDCPLAIPAYYGQSDVWTNTGIVYYNLCGLYTQSGSTWFVFSPTFDDRVKIDVCTSDFDTVLAVVSDCNSLSCVADSDDDCNDVASAVIIDVRGGREYFIFVSGYSGSSGSFRVNISSY